MNSIFHYHNNTDHLNEKSRLLGYVKGKHELFHTPRMAALDIVVALSPDSGALTHRIFAILLEGSYALCGSRFLIAIF